MLSLLGSIASFIPGLTGLATAFFQAKFNKDVALYQAQTGATAAVAQEAIRAQASVQTRWWFVAALIPITAFPFIAWTYKAIVWDKLIMAGTTSTDALTGSLGWAYVVVMSSIFVHGVVDFAVSNINKGK